MRAQIIRNDAAETFAMPHTRGVPIATGADTGGAWEALEMTLAPGAASPPHTLSADKVCYLADGEVAVDVDGESSELTTGDVAHVPAGTAHRYRNLSDRPARLVVLVTGATQVSFLQGMAALGGAGAPDPAAVAEHAAAHGVQFVASAS